MCFYSIMVQLYAEFLSFQGSEIVEPEPCQKVCYVLYKKKYHCTF